jgi:hypothetical protein
MLATPGFAADQQLVLARTLQQPLAEQGRLLAQAGTEPTPFSKG